MPPHTGCCCCCCGYIIVVVSWLVPVVVIVIVRDAVTKLVSAIVGASVVPRSNGVLVAVTKTGRSMTVVMLGGALPREGTVVERGAVGDGSRVEDGASVGDCDGGELVIASVGTNVRIVGTDEGRCVGKGGDVGVAVGRCVIGSTFVVDGL